MTTVPHVTPEPAVDEALARARRKQAAVMEKVQQRGNRWKSASGKMQDTAFAREAWALGEAWRMAQTEP